MEILPRIVRSPVEICFGTSPSQAAKSRPFENTSPEPMAATTALEMIGPIPGTSGHVCAHVFGKAFLAGKQKMSRAISELEDCSLIEIERRGQGKTNFYTVNFVVKKKASKA